MSRSRWIWASVQDVRRYILSFASNTFIRCWLWNRMKMLVNTNEVELSASEKSKSKKRMKFPKFWILFTFDDSNFCEVVVVKWCHVVFFKLWREQTCVRLIIASYEWNLSWNCTSASSEGSTVLTHAQLQSSQHLLCRGCFKNSSLQTQQLGVMQLIQCFGTDFGVWKQNS